MSLTRRDWIRSSSLLAGAGLVLGRDALAMPAAEAAEAAAQALPLGADGRLRMAYNENPYGPPQSARDAMVKYWSEASLYQPAGIPELQRLVAAGWGVPADHVLITQGSSEGLDATAATFARDGEIVGATPTYDRLMAYGQALGASLVPVPLDAGLVHDLPAMERAVGPFTRLVFVCNPNNPTGTIVDAGALEAFCARVAPRAPVFVDEAYFEYVEAPGHRSMMPLVTTGHDVIVSRTASKIHGMAGLRVGFLVARPALLERIRPFVMGFPNAMAVRATIAAVQDTAAQAFVRRQNTASREAIYRALDGLRLRYVPSQGNMVFFQTGRPAREVIAAFAAKGIDVGRPFPPMLDWCRVSTSTPQGTEQFAAALRGVMA
ncbi:MAG: histidinol-phosphate aminotransferase family protein [Gemmatimonadaceae bacterium]|jgi:histidinol-phosphate aminotransferase|nr:histidinol-phosphate aminotransferase family protein [Gemmatimonadaceae bacterium]